MDALRVENLCKRYSGGFALENVSFSLAEGSIMGLIGANGAGKTTTLKALMGYLCPDAGTVTLFGQPFPPENTVLRQRTGFVSGGVDYFPRKRLSAITAGGSQAVFFKMNTLGEESFLDDVKDLLEEILEE